jgi:hypothetical protein
MTSPERLEPRRHAPPPDWPPEVFAALTDALAAALVAAIRRQATEDLPIRPARTEVGA